VCQLAEIGRNKNDRFTKNATGRGVPWLWLAGFLYSSGCNAARYLLNRSHVLHSTNFQAKIYPISNKVERLIKQTGFRLPGFNNESRFEYKTRLSRNTSLTITHKNVILVSDKCHEIASNARTLMAYAV